MTVCLPPRTAPEYPVVSLSSVYAVSAPSSLKREKALSFWAVQDQLVLSGIWFLSYLQVLACFETLQIFKLILLAVMVGVEWRSAVIL